MKNSKTKFVSFSFCFLSIMFPNKVSFFPNLLRLVLRPLTVFILIIHKNCSFRFYWNIRRHKHVEKHQGGGWGGKWEEEVFFSILHFKNKVITSRIKLKYSSENEVDFWFLKSNLGSDWQLRAARPPLSDITTSWECDAVFKVLKLTTSLCSWAKSEVMSLLLKSILNCRSSIRGFLFDVVSKGRL